LYSNIGILQSPVIGRFISTDVGTTPPTLQKPLHAGVAGRILQLQPIICNMRAENAPQAYEKAISGSAQPKRQTQAALESAITGN
jgi:hypothetical protein